MKKSDKKEVNKAMRYNGGGDVSGNRLDSRINGFKELSSKRIPALVLAAILMISIFSVGVMPATPAVDSDSLENSLSEEKAFPQKDFEFEISDKLINVTLITGDVVIVSTLPDGKRGFAITPADPTKLGQNFQILKTERGTYIFPDGVDFSKVDEEFFNIDYLIDEGYSDEAYLPVLISYKDTEGAELKELENSIVVASGKVAKRHPKISIIVAQLSFEEVEETFKVLVDNPVVEKIWLDKKIHVSLSESVPLIGAPTMWDDGYNGSGVEIAILDTGIDTTHPDLDDLDDDMNTTDPKVIRAIDFTNDNNVSDFYGHGTHCAGIAAGTGEALSLIGNSTTTMATSSPSFYNSSEQNYNPCPSCPALNSTPSESSLNSNWSTKPVIVNVQVNLESEEDQKYIYDILSEIESHGWITSVFVTGEFASKHPEVVSEIENKGHYIGVYGWKSGEDLSLLSYNEQLELIKKATSVVRRAVSNPKYVVDFKPQNLKYNDDTIKALQDLQMKSITATFSANESFVQCPYAKMVGKVTFPYPITTDFAAVPISDIMIGSEEVLLDDNVIFNKLATQDYLSHLKEEFEEHNETKDPMVAVISPSVTGADETKLQVFSQFLDYVEENGGKVKPTAPITVLTTFISYLKIISAPQGASPGETVTVTVAFTAEIYCPSYYFRIYGKYPSDAGWTLLTEHYHGVSTGTFSFSRSFTIPEPPAGDSSYKVRVVGQGCSGTCWPTPYSYERMDEVTVNLPPKITEITITPKNPMTRDVTTFEATITKPQGWEIWAIDWLIQDISTGELIDIGHDKEKIEYKFEAGTHGDKEVICTIFYECKATGSIGVDQESKEFKVFFERDGYDSWWQRRISHEPNWFVYWKGDRDGAVLHLTNFRYNPALSGRGEFAPPDRLSVGPSTVNPKRDISGASSIGQLIWVNIRGGIYAVADTVAHERYHKWVYDMWNNDWRDAVDSDRNPPFDDELPDFYETTVSGTWNNDTDTHDIARFFHSARTPHPYSLYGDQEYMARVTAKTNSVAIPARDWANPGSQSDGVAVAARQAVTLFSPQIIGFEVSETGFVGNYSDQGMDFNGNGLYDYLAVTLELNITETADYGIVGWLNDTNGNRIALVNNYYNLTQGTHLLTLYFDGYDITYHRVNGPYSLSLILYDSIGYEIESQYGVYYTSVYRFTEFEGYKAWFTNNYADYGTDTDGDGLYNYLTIEVEVNITIAGNYSVDGYLYDTGGDEIAWAYNSTYLNISTQSVILNFDGISIYKHGVDGPYNLKNLSLCDANNSYIDFVYDAYNTSAYNYTDFQSPPASFRDTYSDYGVDTNADGLYEFLAINVGVNTTIAGNYTLTGWLYDSNGSEIVQASNYTYLDVENQSMLLNFDGTTIYEYGVNGTFNLSYLTLYGENGTMADYRSYAYTTPPYNYTQFYGGGVITGTVTDYNGDPLPDAYIHAIGPVVASTITDINGTYSITRLQSGSYTIHVEPINPNLMTASAYVSITAGQTVVRNFTLQAAGSIAGNITNVNGTGLPDIIVYLSGYETARYRTDENGSYVIPRLWVGTYTINVDATGTKYANAYRTVEVTLGNTTVADFILPEIQYKGVAPGAYLWNVKVLNRYGSGYESWIINGIEYAAYGPDGNPSTGDEADIISMSLGGLGTDGTDPMSQAVNDAVDQGVVVAVAAGNSGSSWYTIESPGVAEKVITVGASTKEDYLAYFSSRGPTIDFRVKPDVIAPGVNIVAPRAGGTWMGYPINDYYTRASGTSMATPHVAGAAALILEANSWTPDDVKNALISTAEDLGYSIYAQGGGRIYIPSAAYTEILVDPATISFGNIKTATNRAITFYNLNTISAHNLTLNVTVYDSYTRSQVACASLNATNLSIAPGSSASVLLTVNPTILSDGIYEGEVIADIDTGETVHAIFGFAKVNRVTISKIGMDGEPAIWEYVQIFEADTVNITYGKNFQEGWTDENGEITFIVSEGTYYIVSSGVHNGNRVYTIADRIEVSEDTYVTLDERDTVPVSIEEDHIVASIQSLLSYSYREGDREFSWSWSDLAYYPLDGATYVSRTTLNLTNMYEYYPKEDFMPSNPQVIDTSEWHKLVYSETGVSGPIRYVPDYNVLVKKTTEYRVGDTPEVAARWAQFAQPKGEEWWPWSSFTWIMNLPQSRDEYLSPDVYYWQWVQKYRDRPHIETPYWYLHDKEWHVYGEGERLKEVWNAHPFSTEFHVERDRNYLRMFGNFFQDANGHGFYSGGYGNNHMKIIRNAPTAHSGNHSWFSGMGGNLNNILDHAFDLTGVSSANLSFWTWYSMGWHNGYLKISTDNGSTWTTLDTYSYGSGANFRQYTYNLTPFVGNNTIIRFQYATYYSGYQGWYIDDIEIPRIGFYDDVESGEGDWVAEESILPITGGTRTVVDETYSTPTYSKIRIVMDDRWNNWIYYEYEFGLTTANGTNYTVSGRSPGTYEDIDDILSYDSDGDGIDDLFRSIYLYAYTSDYDTLDVMVEAWDGSEWILLYGTSSRWAITDRTILYDGSASDEFYYSLYNEPVPMEYTVILEGNSGQYLSTDSRTELNFEVVNEDTDCAPSIIYTRVPGLNLYNIHNGEVKINVLVDDESLISNETLEYSTNDGATWDSAALTDMGKIRESRKPVTGGSRTVVDKTYPSPTYSKLRIVMDDTEDNDWIYYNYNFGLTTAGGTNYTLTGQSPRTYGDINDTLAYDLDSDGIDDLFRSIYLYAYTSDYDTLDVTVEAWDGSEWKFLYGTKINRYKYEASIRNLNNTYVSLRINATDSVGNSISQTTMRGFYVLRPSDVPILCIDPDPPSHDFGNMTEGKVISWTFNITNCGGGELIWNVSDDKPWISVSPASGSTTTETEHVTVTIDTTGLSIGKHTVNLTVDSNGGTTNGTINVSVVKPSITIVKVAPASQTVLPGQNFSVNVTVENVTNMNADGATLHFNSTAMQATGIIEGEFLKSGGSTIPIEEINNTAGTATFAYALISGSVNGSGVLATIEFTTNASVEGTFDLNLTEVHLVRPNATEIPTEVFNGTVTISRPPVLVKVIPETQTVSAGNAFYVNITVGNVTYMGADQATLNFDPSAMNVTGVTEGDFMKSAGATIGAGMEDIDNVNGSVTFFYALTTPGIGVNGNGTLATIYFDTNASAEGVFNLNLTGVVLADGDGGGIDVELYNGTVNLIPFNINITSPENKTYASACVRLNFTVEPEGTVLNWIGYSLDGGANVTITGNTTVSGLGACGHTIVVYARDSNGNMAASNTVYFTLHPGDITGDCVVNIFDLQQLAWAFNSQPGDPDWNPRADLNCDNKVNVFDLQRLAWNFGNDYTVIC